MMPAHTITAYFEDGLTTSKGWRAKTLENPTGIKDAPKEARQDELAVHHLFRNQAEELSPQNSSP
jgi:hypothetical protein